VLGLLIKIILKVLTLSGIWNATSLTAHQLAHHIFVTVSPSNIRSITQACGCKAMALPKHASTADWGSPCGLQPWWRTLNSARLELVTEWLMAKVIEAVTLWHHRRLLVHQLAIGHWLDICGCRCTIVRKRESRLVTCMAWWGTRLTEGVGLLGLILVVERIHHGRRLVGRRLELLKKHLLRC